jgi:phenylpropionate dioxygenase-like ring-hydroxylating dioxygenase large terminal subunit
MNRTEGFEREDIRLPQLKCELWNGFVFASFAEEPPELRRALSKLESALAHYSLEGLRTTEPEMIEDLPFNWKVMMENGLEAYHSSRLHDRYVDYQPSRNYQPAPFDEGDGAIFTPMLNLHIDAGLNPLGQCFFPPISTLTDDDRMHTTFATVPPNLMLGWQPDLLFWFLLLPHAVDRLDLLWGYLLPESTFQLPNFADLLEMTQAGIQKFNEQDLPVASSIQRGLRSRFAPRGRYSWQEESLVQVNRWLVPRYQAALKAED